ncbi:acetyl-CoA synthetase-like protein [Dipodascopsis tothii]|uniref:acetyl-CoA synthetase-like protein n=1 Tax=Dipodascopsis tothii TaxID=44089 RepID=UPI0034CFE79C
MLQALLRSGSRAPALFAPPSPTAVTYEQLESLTHGLRLFLSTLRLPRQTAVAIVLPNGVEFVVAFLGAAYSAFVACPLNPALKQDEFEFYLDDVQASVLLVPQGSPDSLPAVKAARKIGSRVKVFGIGVKDGRLQVEPFDGKPLKRMEDVPTATDDDIALVLHTSGTTGRPKIVPLSHGNLMASMKNISTTYDLSTSDRSLLVMPLFHVHGLMCGLLAALSAGCAVIVPAKFSASTFWDDYTKYGATWYTAVPTIHQILLKNPPAQVPRIRFIRSCSSALAETTFHRLEQTFKAPVIEAYAMTEAAHQMTSNDLPPGKRKPGSVGVGHGVDVAILDGEGRPVAQGAEGEICIKGRNVTRGYHNNAAANKTAYTADGYFRTGDQGRKDPDGFVFITGRIKELINRGGEKISPPELDGVLLSHPAVAEAVVFGVPSELYGQEVEAAVVPAAGKRPSERELIDYVAGKVARFKVPKKIYFTDAIPKTATGKVQRKNVADTFHRPTKAKL